MTRTVPSGPALMAPATARLSPRPGPDARKCWPGRATRARQPGPRTHYRAATSKARGPRQKRMCSRLTAIDPEPIKEQRNTHLEQPVVVGLIHKLACSVDECDGTTISGRYGRNMDGTVPSSRPLT